MEIARVKPSGFDGLTRTNMDSGSAPFERYQTSADSGRIVIT